jgi:Gpi18-like mannosyltransferase
VPQADGVDHNSGVAKSPLSAGAAASGIAILLLVGLLLRLTIAYVLLPGSGFESDLGTFTAWAYQLGQQGSGSFYATASFADYPPGYLYVLWLIGGLGHLLAPLANGDAASVIGSLIKVPPILADITVGYILYRLVLSWRGHNAAARRVALLVAGLYVFNPVTWYDSAIWGQTDAIGALVLLLCVAALIRGNAEGATALAVLAALIKPQFGVVALPIVGVVLLRRHLLGGGSMPHNPVLLPRRLRGWFEYEQGPWRLVSSAVVGLLVMIIVLWPFSLDIPGYISQMAKTAGGYPYLTVNAYNPWAMIGSGGNAPLAFGGGWSSDTIPLLGPIPGVFIGGALLVIGFGLGAVRLGWLADRRSILIVTILLALGFFILPTRVHERYMFPIFAFLPLLAAVNRRWLAAFVLLSIGAFINMHGVLTTPLYATPNLDNMIFGDLFRSPLGIVSSVVLNVIGFAFVAWSLRPQAARLPDEYALPEPAEVDGELGVADQEPDLPAEPWWAPLAALVPPSSCAPIASSSRSRCTSTRSTTPGRRSSSCRTGATACLIRSTSSLTRTWPSTAWPWASRRWATIASSRPASWAGRRAMRPSNSAGT